MPDSPQHNSANIRQVPVRYVGHQAVKLRPGLRHRDGQGALLTSLILRPGDTLMAPEPELRGQTYLVDPRGIASDAQWLGVGKQLLPEHAAAGLTPDDLIGVPFFRDGDATRPYQYEFHAGRSDFAEMDAPWPPVSDEPEAPEAVAADDAPDAADEPAPAARAPRRAKASASGADDAGATVNDVSSDVPTESAPEMPEADPAAQGAAEA